MLAVNFTIAAACGLLADSARGRLRAALSWSPKVALLGLGGFTSYHLAYYFGLKLAPPVEVALLNYLWPLLMVLLSAPILRVPLPRAAAPAALLGFLGAVLVVTQGALPRLSAAHAAGYALGLWAGVSWAVFSCCLRAFGQVAAGRITFYCALAAGFAWLAVAATGGPGRLGPGWLPLSLYLGVGPLFGAFFCWDQAMRLGNVAQVGVLSYLTPALATLWLAAAGEPLAPPSVVGLALIMSAAWLGRRGAATRDANESSETP